MGGVAKPLVSSLTPVPPTVAAAVQLFNRHKKGTIKKCTNSADSLFSGAGEVPLLSSGSAAVCGDTLG